MPAHVVDGGGQGGALADLHRELRAVADVRHIDRLDVLDIAQHVAAIGEFEKTIRAQSDRDPRRLSKNGGQHREPPGAVVDGRSALSRCSSHVSLSAPLLPGAYPPNGG